MMSSACSPMACYDWKKPCIITLSRWATDGFYFTTADRSFTFMTMSQNGCAGRMQRKLKGRHRAVSGKAEYAQGRLECGKSEGRARPLMRTLTLPPKNCFTLAE